MWDMSKHIRIGMLSFIGVGDLQCVVANMWNLHLHLAEVEEVKTQSMV